MFDPKDLKFTKSHEWMAAEGDLITVGISDHAQDLLGDIVFVELPEIGRSVTAGEALAVVESVKAASDIYAPLAGTVEAVNESLDAEPTLVNTSAYGDGWLFKIRLESPDTGSEDLVDYERYQSDFVE